MPRRWSKRKETIRMIRFLSQIATSICSTSVMARGFKMLIEKAEVAEVDEDEGV